MNRAAIFGHTLGTSLAVGADGSGARNDLLLDLPAAGILQLFHLLPAPRPQGCSRHQQRQQRCQRLIRAPQMWNLHTMDLHRRALQSFAHTGGHTYSPDASWGKHPSLSGIKPHRNLNGSGESKFNVRTCRKGWCANIHGRNKTKLWLNRSILS